MKFKTLLLILLITVIIGIGLFAIFLNIQHSREELLKTEQDVYTVLLRNQKRNYSNSPDKLQIVEYIFTQESQKNFIPCCTIYLEKEFSFDDFSGLDEFTWVDFQEKNKISNPIKKYLPTSENVILVNPSNGEQLFWWVSFSRIGFNSSLTQALVLIGDCRGEACYDKESDIMLSEGYYVFLQNESGKWKIKEYYLAWHIESHPN